MTTSPWLLAGLGLVLYSVLAVWARNNGYLPESVKVQGPLTTLHTERGKAFLDRLARYDRFWRAWTNVGLGATLVIMVGSFVLFVQLAIGVVRSPPAPTAVNDPRNVLVIPGVNDFLPLSVAPEIVFGLLLGLVVHEGGHGLLCRVGDIDIDSMGLVTLAVLPIGAFVEPDEQSQREADRGARSRMFAAGVTNNFVLTFVAFALLLGPVVGSIAVAPGAPVGGVFQGSAADEAGIEQGDRIVGIAGTDVESAEDLAGFLANSTERQAQVTLASGETVTVERSLLVTAMAPDSPLAAEGEAGVDVNDTVVAVNGTPVHTEPGFHRAVGNRTSVTIETADGRTVTGPMGVMAVATAGDPLDGAGFPTDDRFLLVSVAGEPTHTREDVSEALAGKEPGDSVRVVAVVDGERRNTTVTLIEDPRKGVSGGFLGVSARSNYAGIDVNSLGIESYSAATFLSLLSGEASSTLLGKLGLLLLLPFIAVTPFGAQLGVQFNFPGFVALNRNFYEITGPLEPLGGAVFLLANVLFWTGWVNVNLAFFNCLPGYPLDGGRILRTSTEAVVSRLPVENKHRLTRTVTTSVGLTMLVCLLVVVFGPQFL